MRKRFQLFMLEYPRYEKRELPSVFVTQPPCFDKDAFFDAVTSPKAGEDRVVLVAQDEYEEPIDSLARTLTKAECVCVSVDAGPTYIRVFTVLREIFESPEKRRARLKSMLGDNPEKEKKKEENFLQRKYRVRKQRKAESDEPDAMQRMMKRLEPLVDLYRSSALIRMIVAGILLAVVLGAGMWLLNNFYQGRGEAPSERSAAEGVDLSALAGDVDAESAQALLDQARQMAEGADGASGELAIPDGQGADGAMGLPDGSELPAPSAWEIEARTALGEDFADVSRESGLHEDELDGILDTMIAHEGMLDPASGLSDLLGVGLEDLLIGDDASGIAVLVGAVAESFGEAARITGEVLAEDAPAAAPAADEREGERVAVGRRGPPEEPDYVQELQTRRRVEASLPGTGPVARFVVAARDQLDLDEARGEVLSGPFVQVPHLPVPELTRARASVLGAQLDACAEEDGEPLVGFAPGDSRRNYFLLAGLLSASSICARTPVPETCEARLASAGCASLRDVIRMAEAHGDTLVDALALRLQSCLDEEGVGHLVSDDNVRALRRATEKVAGLLPLIWMEHQGFPELRRERLDAFPCALLPEVMIEERPALLRHLHR